MFRFVLLLPVNLVKLLFSAVVHSGLCISSADVFQVVCIIDMKTQPLGSYVSVLGCLGTLYFQNLVTKWMIWETLYLKCSNTKQVLCNMTLESFMIFQIVWYGTVLHRYSGSDLHPVTVLDKSHSLSWTQNLVKSKLPKHLAFKIFGCLW